MAAALLASILLSELCGITDDLTDKEDYETLAKQYEEEAEGVLNECYEEDGDRALMLVYRKLKFYGDTSAIRLAARGECIRFMSHPCCQDLLSEVWMGELSIKNGFLRMVGGMTLGLTFPFLIPQVIRYSRQDAPTQSTDTVSSVNIEYAEIFDQKN
ncbi:Transient receptor putative cation channel subfamily M member 2 [Cichlidogyrus casuarinus]|uniref:Transient receptor putative cation channel subfamily M member 2 n=1 Tax=Cichlidogyrus casuarinus TaxID=1844966 RepID=A0ABD2PK88_9PLAT